jgi:hypothetical protein
VSINLFSLLLAKALFQIEAVLLDPVFVLDVDRLFLLDENVGEIHRDFLKGCESIRDPLEAVVFQPRVEQAFVLVTVELDTPDRNFVTAKNLVALEAPVRKKSFLLTALE